MSFCGKEDCSFSKLIENFTQNMFVIVGKLSTLAETLKEFPADDIDEYKEQMREMGDDAGTTMRVIFNFESEAEKEKKASRKTATHSSRSKYASHHWTDIKILWYL